MMETATTLSGSYGVPSAAMVGKLEVSAITSAAATLEEARALASRVDEIVNRLCGTVPQPVSSSDPRPPVSSIFSGLRSDADRTADQVRNAHAQLNRLERELP